MKSAIISEENRSAGNFILMDVNELNFNRETERIITKKNALDGSVITTNWGYPEGNISIELSDILLSYDDYFTLIGMKEDDSYTYLFTYKEKTYKILIKAASGTVASKDMYLCSINLSVIEIYTDMETS